MRVHLKVLAAFALVFTITFAGCLGGEEDLESDDAPEVEFREGLQTRITLDYPADHWFEPGQQIQVSAKEPENAVGNVSYTWFIQKDPFEVFTKADEIDTGEVMPGESAELTFFEPGFYEYGHCDPHAQTMKHTVAVLEDYEGPQELTVYMYEGDILDNNTFGFYPEHITVGPDTTVTYENVGGVMHTASLAHDGEGIPVPTRLDLDEREGTVTLEGEDWMNLVVVMEDDEGNGGWAKKQVYVRDRLEDFQDTTDGSFITGAESEETEQYRFEYGGTLTLNVTLPNDPTQELQRIDVELYELSDDLERVAPVISENNTGPGQLEETFDKKAPREYELVVRPAQGVLIDYEIDIRVVYDHTPPELEDLPCAPIHYYQGHC